MEKEIEKEIEIEMDKEMEKEIEKEMEKEIETGCHKPNIKNIYLAMSKGNGPMFFNKEAQSPPSTYSIRKHKCF